MLKRKAPLVRHEKEAESADTKALVDNDDETAAHDEVQMERLSLDAIDEDLSDNEDEIAWERVPYFPFLVPVRQTLTSRPLCCLFFLLLPPLSPLCLPSPSRSLSPPTSPLRTHL